MSQMRSKGFTLIEILVVIVIIGILATMGIGKYAQFSRDARKSGCVNNQNTIDKGIGMWESKYVAFNLKSGGGGALSCLFFMNGKKHTFTEASGKFPGRFKSTASGKDDEVYNQIQDETVFICPESANSYSGIDNIPQADKAATSDYKWHIFARGTASGSLKPTGGKLRGTGCMVWGTVAPSGGMRGVSGEEIEAGDGTVGPSGTDEDLHSGLL
jgi:prepilin-type N-terminal cleavage/methylation domain-containing protein